MTASTEYVTSSDGTRIGFERSGTGSPLVLVHGTFSDRTRWMPVLPALAARFTVYAVDRRGRGLSGDAAMYANGREFEDIAAVVNSIGGPVDLLGHSYGALCAMEAALLSQHVRRLVLYEPAFRTDGENTSYSHELRERLEAMLERGEREEALSTFFREGAGVPDGELELLRAAPAWPARVAIAHTIVREHTDGEYVFEPRRFRDFTSPVLLLSGSASPAVLRAATEAALQAFPISRIVAMEDQGHDAVDAAPDLFARLVIEFLTDPVVSDVADATE